MRIRYVEPMIATVTKFDYQIEKLSIINYASREVDRVLLNILSMLTLVAHHNLR